MLSWRLIILVALTTTTWHVDAQVLNLFGNTHFYDFEVTYPPAAQSKASASAKNNIPSLLDHRFEYLILNDVKCAPKTSKSIAKDAVRAFKDVQFNAKPLMYSNSWKTLSFLLSVQFQVKGRIESLASFYGYELKFHRFDDPDPTCIQVIPQNPSSSSSKQPDAYSDKNIVMNIKDPAFVSHKDKNNLYNFGKIALSVLVSCKNASHDSEVCVSDSLTLETPDFVGVPSVNTTIDTSLFPIKEYICNGSIAYQTCILRYTSYAGGSYIIIHQPMPEEVGSLAGFDYFGLDDTISVASQRNQMFKNGLDIKLIKVAKNQPYLYSTIVTGLNQELDTIGKEICTVKNKFCYCDPNKCEKRIINANAVDEVTIHNYCLLNKEDYLSKSRQVAVQLVADDLVSKQCISNPFFQAFNYSQVDLVEEFQGRRLDFPRRSDEIDDDESFVYEQTRVNSMTYTREMLPRVCLLNKDFVSVQQYSLLAQGQEMSFDLVFVSKFKTAAQSSLFSRSFSFELNFYSFELQSCELSESKSSLAANVPLTPIHPTLLLNKIVNLNEAVELKSIKLSSNYLIELIPIANSSLCEPGQCVDESDQNNKIVCRPCNKLVVYIRTNAPQKSKKKSFDFNTNECSVDLKEYQDALLSSFFNKDNLQEFNLSLLNSFEKHAGFPGHQLKLLDIYSGFLPTPYSIQQLRLPVTAGTCIVKPHPSLYLYLSMLLALCAIFMVCSLLLYNYAKTRTAFVGRVNERKVVFYVPAKDKIHFERLEDLAKSYKNTLKSWFKELRVEIVSDTQNIKYPLKKYDLIVYTCADTAEFEQVNSIDLNREDWMSMMKIGQGPYDDDFNQLHFVKAYKSKCIDIVDESRFLQNQTRLMLHGLALGSKYPSYRDSHFNFDLYFSRNAATTTPKQPPRHDTPPEKINVFLRFFKQFSVTKLVKKITFQLNKMYLRFLLRRIQTAIVKSLVSRIQRAKGNYDMSDESDVSFDSSDD